MKDKFNAVWVSHSSISMYLKCPRAYFLANMYKDPVTKHKISIAEPPMALGQAVHNALDAISVLPSDKRFEVPLMQRFEDEWKKVSGKIGGFRDEETEVAYKERGRQMIENVSKNPGPLLNKAIKIPQDLPYFWLSEEENIILCGKVDWLEYMPESDGIHIIDFKTGRYDEDGDSLQLPIYLLLVKNTQKRHVDCLSYWYLDRETKPREVELPDDFEAFDRVLTVAQKIAVARKLEKFVCPQKDGCNHCLPYEKILKGEAELVGTDNYNRDIYLVSNVTAGSTSQKDRLPNYEEEPF